VVAPAPAFAAPLKFSPEQGAVSFFVRLKLPQFAHQYGSSKAASGNLAPIDVYGAMLARMIDLEDAVPK
jgi:hypothetical protein